MEHIQFDSAKNPLQFWYRHYRKTYLGPEAYLHARGHINRIGFKSWRAMCMSLLKANKY